ncbi:hypothetical protein EDL98_11645 [Ornithobacterium rhinotracheale]|uniref:hypothetical protein n=1 Tax=Ornithobacterium rhinotracheale TaxID=28251 RepID=UPI00129C9CC1|nr:hypothetical protein [Ornithobacterium rhinotracheale]MRJ11712.1 hypothetical protein [Ornithobacterium rhinotracheale]
MVKESEKNTGLSVLENHWDGYRVKPNLRREQKNNHELINLELQEIEEKVRNLFIYLKANQIPFSTKNFNELFESKSNVVGNKYDFFSSFDEYIDSGRIVCRQTKVYRG